MNNYDKPMILANEELAEGVYAASGTIGPGGGEWKVNSAKVDGSSPTGQYPGYTYVNINLTPGSSSSCTVTISFTDLVTDAQLGNESLASWSLSLPSGGGTTLTATLTGGEVAGGYDNLVVYVKTASANLSCTATVN